MNSIRIPPALRDSTGGAREVEVRGATIRELLEELVSRFPALRGPVYDGDVAPFVNVYVDGVDVRTLGGLDTPVPDGSTVILLPAMAGGLADLATLLCIPVATRIQSESRAAAIAPS